MLTSLVLLIIVSSCVLGHETIVLENKNVLLEFNQAGHMVALIDKSSSVNLMNSHSTDHVDPFKLKFVDSNGVLSVDKLKRSQTSLTRVNSTQVLSVKWEDTKLFNKESLAVAAIDIDFIVSLEDASSSAELNVGFTVTGGVPVGIWELDVSIPLTVGHDSKGELFMPRGFGVTYSDPLKSAEGGIKSDYPSSAASMQFMALGSTDSPSAAYVAALDVNGEAKGLSYSPHPETTFSTLGFSVYPADSGVVVPVGTSWRMPFNLALGVLSNVNASAGFPLWIQAGSMYREWVLDRARWTIDGPLASKEFPRWYTDNSIWLNTHWACHDILNETGGDPNFVLPYTQEVAARLNEPSLNLHWYEWQQGPDPDPAARYKFDTHYPDYFPARPNFGESVRALLEESRVSSFPYINGRISDVNSDAYIADNGAKYCSKATDVKLINETTEELTAYVESYGSNATFCVTDPFSDYWQDKIASTVETLVTEYGVAGVYIDQVASAGPKLCWDEVHEHSLGGGDFWTKGYESMMKEVQQRLQEATGNGRGRPMVTEDNAEPYMNVIQGYLTLNAFKHSFGTANSSHTNSSDAGRDNIPFANAINNTMIRSDVSVGSMLPATTHMAPAFPMIYGGYYVGFGAVWTRADFVDHDWFCAKLANTFVTGTQMGWFSLAGTENDPDDPCGPMGVGDLLLDSANDEIIGFLQLLARSRAAVTNFFVHGHLINPPVLRPQPTVQVVTVGDATYDYDTVVSSAWRSIIHPDTESTAAVLVNLIGVTSVDTVLDLVVDFATWKFDSVDILEVWRLAPVPTTGDAVDKVLIGVMHGPHATFSVTVHGRSALLLQLTPASSSNK